MEILAIALGFTCLLQLVIIGALITRGTKSIIRTIDNFETEHRNFIQANSEATAHVLDRGIGAWYDDVTCELVKEEIMSLTHFYMDGYT